MTLVDRDNARMVGIGFYASAGQAQQAGTLLTTMFEDARAGFPTPSGRRSTCSPKASACTRSCTGTELPHVPLVLLVARLPVPSRWLVARLLAAGRPGDRCCGEAPRIEATYLFTNTQRGISMPRVRYTLTAMVAALLLPLPALATAKGDHSKGASKSRQAERLRQTEQRRLRALVDADVAVAGALIASDSS
jgi:hypothetical protein